jgi:hypothetical protein
MPGHGRRSLRHWVRHRCNQSHTPLANCVGGTGGQDPWPHRLLARRAPGAPAMEGWMDERRQRLDLVDSLHADIAGGTTRQTIRQGVRPAPERLRWLDFALNELLNCIPTCPDRQRHDCKRWILGSNARETARISHKNVRYIVALIERVEYR